MLRLAAPLVGLVAACLLGCSQRGPSYGPEHQLSDDEIAAYAAKVRQATFEEGGERILGVHNGTIVVAEFLYFDDNESTLGIIHYDVEPGEACKRAGGVVRLEWVPAATAPAAYPQPYCVPKVLVDRNIQMAPGMGEPALANRA